MENQRIRLSKNMLKSALLELLKGKSIDQISICELCQTAQINRTTFYKYYGNQRDLLKEIESDFLTDLNEDLKDVIEQNPNALMLVLNDLYRQRETFSILVKALSTQEFCAHLFSVPTVSRIFQDKVGSDSNSDTETKYIRQFVFQGTFAVLCNWLESEDPEPVSEIAGILESLRDKL